MNLLNILHPEDIRIENIVHIGGMAASGESHPQSLEVFLKDMYGIPELQGVLSDGSDGADQIDDMLTLIEEGFGDLWVQFATPKKDSWNWYVTRWFHGKTLEDLVPLAIGWKKGRGETINAKPETRNAERSEGGQA